MGEFDTFGITLPVREWRALLELARRADRTPSDYLRVLIRREAVQQLGRGASALYYAEEDDDTDAEDVS